MEGSIKELSQYRFRRSLEDLDTAKVLYEENHLKSSINRSYYSIFHGLRAVTALDGFDSGKHSGIISYINRYYDKEGIFDKNLSKILDTTYRLREKADYQDFFIVSKDMALEQLEKAHIVSKILQQYLDERWMTL